MKRIIWGCGLALLLVGAVSAAGPTFEQLDTDRNGKLELNELDAAAVKLFRDADVNRDGVLDRHEFKRIQGQSSSFDDLDANRDEKIDLGEIRRSAALRFDRHDLNQNGALDDMECSPNRMPTVSPLMSVYF
ncbi:MAG: hypothetical protein PHV00_09830 [Syntrophales bacterium]|jgi:Ca2+-binding EF-hand superfamily protein|nr:hypothetical protein [Syntrophales bacterium]